MSRAKIFQGKIVEDDKSFLALYLETKNASLVLLSEEEDQLGTLAVAIPQTQKIFSPPLSSVLLGDRNIITARFLAESLAEKNKKIALVSVFTKTLDERKSGPIFLKLVEKAVRKEGSEK